MAGAPQSCANFTVDMEGRRWYAPMVNYQICHAEGCSKAGVRITYRVNCNQIP
jgi:hypothetical protein